MNTFNLSSPPIVSHRLSSNPPWIALVGVSGGLLDLGIATMYWSQHQLAAIRIPQGIAAWLLGSSAFSGGLATALFGVVLYCSLICGVCAAYHYAARRYAQLLHHPYACGALYGVLAYGLIFWVAVPLLTGNGVGSTRPEWIGLCIAVFALAIGIPCSLSARHAIGRY